MTVGPWTYAVAVVAALVLLGGMGTVGRTVRRMLMWGAIGATVFVLLDAIGAPAAVVAPANPFTVGAAALLGPSGIGLAVLAHALYR